MTTQRIYSLAIDLRLHFNIESESEKTAEAILKRTVADPRFLMLGLVHGVTSQGFEPQWDTLVVKEATR